MLRGAFGVAAGAAMLTTPRDHPAFLVPLMSGFLLVDGVFGITSSLGFPRRRGLWVLPASLGMLTVFIGLFALGMPSKTPGHLASLVTNALLTRGILEFAIAVELRRSGLPERALTASATASLLTAWTLALQNASSMERVSWIAAAGLIAGGLALARQGEKLHRVSDARLSRRHEPNQAALPDP